MARTRKTKAKKMRSRKLWLIFGSIGLVLVGVAVLLWLILRPIHIQSISFDDEEIVLKAGESLTLQHSYIPIDATETALSFKSSNRDVARVENGILTAVKEGSCYISVTAESGAKDTLRVQVEAPLVAQEESLMGLWWLFAVQENGELHYVYNDDSSLSLTEERNGSLLYEKAEYLFPDWRYDRSDGSYDYFTVQDASQQKLKMYFCTDSSNTYEKCLMLELSRGELLLFRQEKEAE